jgi:hypothetical protein
VAYGAIIVALLEHRTLSEAQVLGIWRRHAADLDSLTPPRKLRQAQRLRERVVYWRRVHDMRTIHV